jgi:nitrite reductase/ring-hydroxylating ferredoxin subunit
MKKTLTFLLLLPLILSCNKEKFSNENPYLPNYSFSMEINTSLPTYNQVTFASNSIKVFPANGPTRGVIVFNTGTSFLAFDGGCPNQDLSSCSTLTISGINANCPCDSASYNLFTGQAPGKEYPLKQYRTEVNGNIIRVYN